MASKVYPREKLLALRGAAAQASLERQLIDRLSSDEETGRPSTTLPWKLAANAHAANILRVRHVVLYTNGVDHGSADQRTSTESEEPIRQQLDGQGQDQDLEWKLAARSPKADVNRPLPAPGDMRAQASEGFQRFFKAVASPTHVRVTAGGRIVPNNRGSSSPVSKQWSKEKPNGDHNGPSQPPSQTGWTPVAGQVPAPFLAVPTGFPGFGALPPVHGTMPFVQYPMGSFGFPMPPMAMHPPAGSQASSTNIPTDQEKAGTASEKKGVDQSSPKPVTDQPSAFVPKNANFQGPYPGLFPPIPCFPAPMSMPMMHPQPAFPAYSGSPVASPMPPQMAFHPQFGNLPYPGAMSAFQIPAMGMPPFPSAAGFSQSQQAVHARPKSSIRMSEVTKKQLEGLQGHLKWAEDQLHFNKHQIDEPDMQRQVANIRDQIRTFEKALQQQLAAEDSSYASLQSKSEGAKDLVREPAKSTVQAPVKVGESTNSSTATNEIQSQAAKQSLYSNPSKRDFSKQKPLSKQKGKIWKSSTDTDNQSDALSSALSMAPLTRNPDAEPRKKSSGLPMNAALAPPFQPRMFRNATPGYDSSGDFGGKSSGDAAPYSNVPSATPAFNTDSMNSLEAKKTDAGREAGKPVVLDARKQNFGMPYLEGKLPQGIDPRKARDADYLYPRQLTKDEIRARHLYWGNAPSSVLRGLPKYDGKDFYPPSPVKEDKLTFEKANTSAIPIGGFSDYNPKPSPAVKVEVETFTPMNMKELLQYQLDKSEKRFTKSDNINGGASPTKRSSGRTRPMTSLESQQTTDSDQTGYTGDAVRSSQSLQRSSQSPDSDSSHELLFAGRSGMQRSR